MKCAMCDGKGYAYVGTAPNPITQYGYKRICDKCHGTGEIEQTNEEWLRQATTDGMTEIFMRFMFDAEFKARFVNGNFINEFRKWLKEIHK